MIILTVTIIKAFPTQTTGKIVAPITNSALPEFADPGAASLVLTTGDAYVLNGLGLPPYDSKGRILVVLGGV